MEETILNILAISNDVLQSAIVIFGSSVVLYNLGYSIHDRVTRAFTAVVAFVVIVYMTELLVSYIPESALIGSWLRLEWIGIANVPAAMFHLSDALLVTTGLASRRRRLLVRVGYTAGVIIFIIAAFTDYLVGEVIIIPRAPHLTAGPLFPVFAAYYWLVTIASVYNVWRARQRCLTYVTRERMTYILLAMIAAPLGVYPYLLISGNPNLALPATFWLVLLAGNLFVGILFTILTLQLVYFGSSSASPERVVRVRLYKYLARVPMTATLVLTAMVLVSRTSSFLGLPPGVAEAFAAVSVIIVWGWFVHTFKRAFQRVLQIDDNPDVRRILQLSERIVTTRELHDYLETVLAAACEGLRTPSAFIVTFTAEGPALEVAVGPPADLNQIVANDQIRQLAAGNGRVSTTEADIGVSEEDVETAGDLFVWEEYWMRPLYDRENSVLLGLLGLRARGEADLPDFEEQEQLLLERISLQAATALEDRILQQQVFAAVEDLLPLLNNLQEQRSATTFGGSSAITAGETPLDDPEFNNMVKDALSHYWGGPKLTESPLLRLQVVQEALQRHEGNPTRALREILQQAIERQKPPGERSMTRTEWLMYNILELKFVEGQKVRDVARRLAMSESDLYRKQRIAIENVARTINDMEREQNGEPPLAVEMVQEDDE